MTKGTYCVDTTANTADVKGDTLSQAALDNCETWEDDFAVGKFQVSSVLGPPTYTSPPESDGPKGGVSPMWG